MYNESIVNRRQKISWNLIQRVLTWVWNPKHYRFSKICDDVGTLLLKKVISHFIGGVVESKETYLHIFWKLIHCIDIPSEHIWKQNIWGFIMRLCWGYHVYIYSHQPVNSICKEFKFLQCSINIINIIYCCYHCIYFRQHSPTISKLRLKYHPHGPQEILHQPVPRKAQLFSKTCASPPPIKI